MTRAASHASADWQNFVQLLPTRSQPAQNVGESASLDDDRLDVGVGVGSAVGLWTASHGFVPTGTVLKKTTLRCPLRHMDQVPRLPPSPTLRPSTTL